MELSLIINLIFEFIQKLPAFCKILFKYSVITQLCKNPLGCRNNILLCAPASSQLIQSAPGGPRPEKKKTFVDPLLQRKDSAATESKVSDYPCVYVQNIGL